MYFTEKERAVYTPPGSAAAHDPLALLRALTVAAGGRSLKSLIDAYNAGLPAPDGAGPTDLPRTDAEAVAAAQAEEVLVRAGRAAFGLPAFPDCLDADALTAVFDFTRWLEGNG